MISIECSRSRMEMLNAFERLSCPNGIGPWEYDIHSPRVPTEAETGELLGRVLRVLLRQLWVIRDCVLKTRRWEEVEPALTQMVATAK